MAPNRLKFAAIEEDRFIAGTACYQFLRKWEVSS